MARSDIGFPFLVPLSKPILKGIWDPVILRPWMTMLYLDSERYPKKAVKNSIVGGTEWF